MMGQGTLVNGLKRKTWVLETFWSRCWVWGKGSDLRSHLTFLWHPKQVFGWKAVAQVRLPIIQLVESCGGHDPESQARKTRKWGVRRGRAALTPTQPMSPPGPPLTHSLSLRPYRSMPLFLVFLWPQTALPSCSSCWSRALRLGSNATSFRKRNF